MADEKTIREYANEASTACQQLVSLIGVVEAGKVEGEDLTSDQKRNMRVRVKDLVKTASDALKEVKGNIA